MPFGEEDTRCTGTSMTGVEAEPRLNYDLEMLVLWREKTNRPEKPLGVRTEPKTISTYM